MDVFEAVQKRHSIRAYKSTPIPEEKLKRILESARLAPSAGNIQPWYFVVVKNREERETLAKGGRYARFLAESPIAIVGCGDQKASPNWYAVDVAIALQNIYQTLIWWTDKKPVTFTPGVGYNLTIADYADLDQYGPVLATEVPTVGNGRIVVNASGSYWRFTINTNAQFQPWVDHLGNTVPARNITAADVVYSFRRQVVYDSIYSPDWMWMKLAFGYSSWRDVYGGPYPFLPTDTAGHYTYNGTFLHAADEAKAGVLITNWCYAVGNDVYFNFTLPWAEGVLKQIFAQTWGGVVNPDWVKEMGGWDGLFTTGASDSNMMAGWTNNYHWKPTSTRSELDTYKSPTTFPGHGSKYAAFTLGAVGTGPYKFTSWDTTNKIWRIDAWETATSPDGSSYWKGFGQAGDKLGNYFHTVIEKGIDAWPTRKMLFLEGEFDVAAVPRANMYDLLTSTYNPISGVNLVYNIAALQNDVMLYDFSVPYENPYQSYVGYPHKTGPEQFFFNNTHIRRAFAWALNYTAYLQDAWSNEGILQRSWWVEGLSPQSYKNTNASMPQRNLNYTEMQNELNQAVFDGYNVGTEGFEMTLLYDIGNDQQLIACNLIAQAFLSLGSKYKCNVVGLDWPWILDPGWFVEKPMHDVSWVADFADSDNFCEPYQASWGSFCSGQFDPANNAQPEDQAFVDQEIHAALVEPDSAKRGAMYQDLQYRYWLDVPSFPLIQPVGRRWARDWVQGWYFNALFPGLYAYDLWKSLVPLENVDVDMTATVTPATPTYSPVYIFHNQMRKGNGDPSPASMTFTLHVVRNDANGAITILYAAVGLTRTLGSDKQFANGTYVALLVGGSASATVIWWEDGTNQVMAGNTTGIPYDVAGEAYPINANANDTDNGNNQQSAGTLIAMTLLGDTTGDGFVDIFDAIQLAKAFGTTPGSYGWNPDADLNSDGYVDIYDAIMLSDNFNNHVP
jgi:peptide/nickel transport system substrate-binding protein